MTKSLYTIVGMKHRGTEALVAGLPRGETLTLVREPTNAHDSNAVQVWARGVHVAYVLARQALYLARDMDTRALKETPAMLTFDGRRSPSAEAEI